MYSDTGNMPATLAVLAGAGWVPQAQGSYEGDYVLNMDVVNGDVVCNLKVTTLLGTASGGHVTFNSDVDGIIINWTVESSNVEDKHLPALN